VSITTRRMSGRRGRGKNRRRSHEGRGVGDEDEDEANGLDERAAGCGERSTEDDDDVCGWCGVRRRGIKRAGKQGAFD
jgi:hypothetical protein